MRIIACMASTLDGKIGPPNVDRFVSISSAYDLDHLLSLRDTADGILVGADTYRAWPKPHLGHNKDQKPHHFIMSRSLDLDRNSPLFQDTSFPLTIFTPHDPPIELPAFPEHVNLVVCPEGPMQITTILQHIEACGVKSLLLEGGGQILSLFIQAKALQELYLTLVPTIIAQPDAPGLIGKTTLSTPPVLNVLESKIVGSETYLHLRLSYT